jgi:hypothetical protein
LNIENIIEVIGKVTTYEYPDEPEVSQFCEKIIKWEAENSAYNLPRYNEPYRRMVDECLKSKEE